MPLYKVNSFASLGVTIPAITEKRLMNEKAVRSIPKSMTFNAFNEQFKSEDVPKLGLIESSTSWGYYLKKLKLLKNFDFDLFGWTKPTNKVYLICICWDYSGNPPVVYPPVSIDKEKVIIPMKKDKDVIFLGDGINLWPSKKVVGGLNVLIMLFESDQDIRDIGESLVKVREEVNKSTLMEKIIAIAANPQKILVDAIAGTVKELIGIVGAIMKSTNNEAVDVFQGTYGTDKKQESKSEISSHDNSEIEVEIIVQ